MRATLTQRVVVQEETVVWIHFYKKKIKQKRIMSKGEREERKRGWREEGEGRERRNKPAEVQK